MLTNFNSTIAPFENLYNRWNPVNIPTYDTTQYYEFLKDTSSTFGTVFVKTNLELFQDFVNTINPALTYQTDVTDIRNQLNAIFSDVNEIRVEHAKILPPEPDLSVQGLFGANNAEFEPNSQAPPPPPPPGPPPPPWTSGGAAGGRVPELRSRQPSLAPCLACLPFGSFRTS